MVVALDGSKTASHALDTAIRLALDIGARLQALYVVGIPVIAFHLEQEAPRRRRRKKLGQSCRWPSLPTPGRGHLPYIGVNTTG